MGDVLTLYHEMRLELERLRAAHAASDASLGHVAALPPSAEVNATSLSRQEATRASIMCTTSSIFACSVRH